MTSNHVPLISVFKMTFRMTLRMTFRMKFKIWDFKRVFKGYLEGDFKGDLEVDLEIDLEGDFRGDFKQDLEEDLLSSSGQLRFRSGLVQVWSSIQRKFNSFELDSEVGRLVFFKDVLIRLNFSLWSHCKKIFI